MRAFSTAAVASDRLLAYASIARPPAATDAAGWPDPGVYAAITYTVADSLGQALRRLRPRCRRFFSTARPPRVRDRRRKPCFFLRLRLLGWKVRFTHGLLEVMSLARPARAWEGPCWRAAVTSSVRARRRQSQRGARRTARGGG